jgi:hypothetical protein
MWNIYEIDGLDWYLSCVQGNARHWKLLIKMLGY